jgi:DNA-binding transcriptional LysR family regulator
MVADNAADIGIYTDAADDGALEVFPYRRDRMVLVTRSDHPLAGADVVAFAQTLPFAYVGMHPGSAGNDQLLRAAEAAGAALTMHFQVTSYDAMISMIKAGLGIGVMPRDAIALFANEGLSIMPLSDAWANRQLKLCVRSKTALTSAARRLLDHLCAAAAETADGPATSAIAASS